MAGFVSAGVASEGFAWAEDASVGFASGGGVSAGFGSGVGVSAGFASGTGSLAASAVGAEGASAVSACANDPCALTSITSVGMWTNTHVRKRWAVDIAPSTPVGDSNKGVGQGLSNQPSKANWASRQRADFEQRPEYSFRQGR